jgi:ABC-2 type transport system permease protein
VNRNWLRTPVVIAAVGLRRLSRDRIGLFFTFLLPLMIIALLGAAIPSGDRKIGFVDSDVSSLSVALVNDLDTATGLAIRRYDSDDELRKDVRRKHVEGGMVVPAGYESDVRAGRTVAVSLYVLPSSSSATALRTALNSAVGHQSGVVGAAQFARAAVTPPPGTPQPGFDQALAAATASAAGGPSLAVHVESATTTGYQSLTVGQYATAGELVLFIFLISLVGAGEFVDTRRLGISRRMLASPTTAPQVIMGEGLNRLLTSGLQAAVIVSATALVFGISWGSPLGIILVVTAFALVSVGAGLLMGTIARTNEQATSMGPIIGISLGMLGGCMWPLEIVPSRLRTVGHFTPHSWALDAMIRLMGEGRGYSDVLRPVAMLLAFAALLIPLAARRLNRSITT